MPTYEFKCVEGHITEQVLPISSEQKVMPCGQCEGQAQRIISLSSFQFKCGGFYQTDYARENTTAGSED